MLVYHSKRLNGIGKAQNIRLEFGSVFRVKLLPSFVGQGVLRSRDGIKINFKLPVKMPRDVFAMTKF